MTTAFQQQFNQELLLSERRRAVIVIWIFSAAITFRLIHFFLIGADEETKFLNSFSTVWLFPIILILFEVLSLLRVNRLIKSRNKKIPVAGQFINTIAEICLPSVIILSVARQYPGFNILHSPVIYIYFVFITLSTLRLKFWLSFFCGLLSSASYISFAVFLYGHFNTNDVAVSFIMFLCGVASGLVAKQINNGISNAMNESEKRRRVEGLFGQQISVEVAEKMLENNGRLESKKMNIAVMFIDIRNFSSFASNRTPEEIVKYQNSFFGIVINTVAEYNGIVHQFLGDGCMVTFGAPIMQENPSANAVAAAIELKQNLYDEFKKGKIPETTVGIGIHYGDAVTGNIGTQTRQQYSITGNVVIMAARVEQLNKRLNTEILITEDVFKRAGLKAGPSYQMETINVKGFEKPVTIFKLA